jgi:uncharacterized protein YukE
MKGIFDMTTPILAQLDGIANNAQGLQGVSDNTAAICTHLGSTVEALGANFQGQGGTAMQAAGHQLITEGQAHTAMFADHSHMMANNAAFHANNDADQAHILGQVSTLH